MLRTSHFEPSGVRADRSNSTLLRWLHAWLEGRSRLPYSLEARRPSTWTPPFAPPPGLPRVLALGIHLGDQPNTARDVARRLDEAISIDVTQDWTAIGRRSRDRLLRAQTRGFHRKLMTKYLLLEQALARHDLASFDYLILIDDDILLAYGFLDAFLTVQRKFGFAIAQPARTSGSFIDLPIVERHPGLIARSTLFVEQGPVVCFHRDCFEFLLPFDSSSPMGWGFENVWSIEATDRRLKLGIVDSTPVDHSLRPPLTNYDWNEADQGRSALLASRRHRSNDDCFRVLDAMPLEP